MNPQTGRIHFRAVFANEDDKLTPAAVAPEKDHKTARVRLSCMESS